MDFKKVKNGYDKNQVDNYLNILKKQNEIEIADLKVQLLDYKAKIAQMSDKINKYEQEQDLIKTCIIKAQQKADEIIYTSKVRFALEGERLKVFQDKCNEDLMRIEYKLRPEYKKEIDEYFENVKKEIDTLFRSEFHVTDFLQ